MSKARDLADSVAAGSVLADGVVSLSEVGGGTNNGVVFVNGSGTTTSGSALTFDGSNVGINTATPATALNISGSTGNGPIYTASISGTTMDVTAITSGTIEVGQLVFGENIQPGTRITALGTGTGGTGTYTVSVSQTADSGSTYSSSNAYGTNILRITSTDTSVVAGQPDGIIQFYGSDNNSPAAGVGAYIAAISEDTNPDTALVFGTRDDVGGGVDANERVRIDSVGNVGIGTSSPIARIHAVDRASSDLDQVGSFVGGTANTSGAGAYISIGNANGAFRGVRVAGINTSGASGAHDMVLYTNVASTAPEERVRITSDGNVGIGTSSPESPLEVNGGTTNRVAAFISTDATAAIEFADNSTTNRPAIGAEGNDITLATNGEKMRITNDGNVGIGTDSPTALLDVLGAGTVDTEIEYAILRGGGSSQPCLRIGGNNTTSSLIRYAFINSENISGGAQALAFQTGGSEAMRITSSGNLGVACTSTPAASDVSTGLWYEANDYLVVSRSDGVPFYTNRVGTDGDTIIVRKDGTNVGNIGVKSGTFYIGNNNTGIRFSDSSAVILPSGTAGAIRDAAIDVGTSAQRFKDLYLSGGVYLGGTGSANHLDDYEEGTWTPVIADATTGGNTGSATISYANYTKIGRQVTVTANIVNINTTGMTSGVGFIVRGLPFTSSSSNSSQGSCTTDSITYPASRTMLCPQVSVSDSWITFIASSSGTTDATLTVGLVTSGTADIGLTITYFV